LSAAVARLQHAAQLASDRDRSTVLVQLARAVGELGDPIWFDSVIEDAWRVADSNAREPLAAPYALHEVQLRGLIHTGRSRQAILQLDRHLRTVNATAPQWQAILAITRGEVLLADADGVQAAEAFQAAIVIAERHRLPHQIQRVVRVSEGCLPATHELAQEAVNRLSVPGS
jgi:hypothetical protein